MNTWLSFFTELRTTQWNAGNRRTFVNYAKKIKDYAPVTTEWNRRWLNAGKDDLFMTELKKYCVRTPGPALSTEVCNNLGGQTYPASGE